MNVKVFKFWAPWCGPCKVLGPTMEEVKEDMSHIEFEDVNVDEQQDVAGELGVMSVPTVVIVKNGKEVERFTGFRPAEQIKSIIEKHV